MTFDWHMLYPLHTVILDNSQVFGGVPRKAQLCNFSKWFFSPRFGPVPIWELWQFCYVRIEPPKPLPPGEPANHRCPWGDPGREVSLKIGVHSSHGRASCSAFSEPKRSSDTTPCETK